MELSSLCARVAPNQRLNITLKCVLIQKKSKQFGDIKFYCRIIQIIHIHFDYRDWNGLQTKLHEMIEATVTELLQPNENNLTPQSK